MVTESYEFAGFTFPRHIPEFFASRYNRRKLASGREVSARMRFAYYTAPKPQLGGISYYLDSDFAPGLRWQWCDDVAASIRHTGWWTDEHGDSEKIRGLVARLPHGRGFLAGWSMGESMASTIETDCIYSSEHDAALAADSLAESAADKERDYQSAERARLDSEVA